MQAANRLFDCAQGIAREKLLNTFLKFALAVVLPGFSIDRSIGSFATSDSDSKRRATPLPRPIANMKLFTPDTSIASDVIPSANFGERNKGRVPDMILLHYTGMPDAQGAS